MDIPAEIGKNVVFLYCNTQKTGMQTAGTAFLVSIDFPDIPREMEVNYMYLVTAKHVIEGIKSHTEDGEVYVRVNTKGGGSALLSMAGTEWVTDASADIAVADWEPPSDADLVRFPLEGAATAENLASKNRHLKTGDDTFLVGAFLSRVGQTKNIPIIRVGNIAALADEPVVTRVGEQDAYLVECRSVMGLSGSPVFVHYEGPHQQMMRPGMNLMHLTGRQFFLLGVMHGHYPTRDDELVREIEGLGAQQLNTGIAVVVRVERLIDLLNREDLRRVREEAQRVLKTQIEGRPPET